MMTTTPSPRPYSRRILDGCAHVLVLLAVALVFLVLRAVAIVLLPFRRRTWVARSLHTMFRTGLGTMWAFFKYTGLLRVTQEGEPAPPPAVLLSNHPSFIDALLLLPKLPNTACLYKSTLERGFFPRSLAENAGFVSNEKGVESIRESVIRLREGWRMLVFPEGTRTVAKPMEPWKSSYALMAARAKAPVQPVYLKMNSPVFPKNAPWWSPPRFPIRVSIRFGAPVPPPAEASVRQFHRKMEGLFREELLRGEIASTSTVPVSK